MHKQRKMEKGRKFTVDRRDSVCAPEKRKKKVEEQDWNAFSHFEHIRFGEWLALPQALGALVTSAPPPSGPAPCWAFGLSVGKAQAEEFTD